VKLAPRNKNEKKAEIIGVREIIMLDFPICIYDKALYHRYRETP
jgi:hypothetical protein